MRKDTEEVSLGSCNEKKVKLRFCFFPLFFFFPVVTFFKFGWMQRSCLLQLGLLFLLPQVARAKQILAEVSAESEQDEPLEMT